MNKPNCLKRHELKALIYETLYQYPQGATAHTIARRMGYSHSHTRTAMNEMIVEYPDYVTYTEDIHRNMVRKTYIAKNYGREIVE